jgi:hypothetical protein
MITLALVLAIAALVCAVAAGLGKAPLWVAVVLLAILETLRVLPIG